jgi:hypothetical protein
MYFYNVKKRLNTNIDDSKVTKTKFTNHNTGKETYAFRAVDDDGTKLTRFVSKDKWEAAKFPEE